MLGWLTKVLGDANERELKKLRPLVERINSLEPEVEPLTDAELRARFEALRRRHQEGESLDALLPLAFALVREVAKRRLGERHFDVQLMGGIVLHQGKIAEMKTGEGKTLVATLPLSLNALSGKGCHLVTQNDYLAKRDVQWMGPIYHTLGLSVGLLQHDAAYIFDPSYKSENPSLRHLRPVPRREAYLADITYGTNNEFGFDYLRDNLVTDLSQKVQRLDHPHHYAIVDEVDNILIDEARTPLIISGPAEESTEIYYRFANLVRRLSPGADYTVDEKHRSVTLTEAGIAKVERLLGIKNIYDPENYRLTRYLEAALKAHALFKRDRDYVVKDGQVIIVDEFTGRLMLGRRWSDGLHQAVEAKEGVKVQQETITYATITLQNYFRMYEKLAGMTGTAATSAEEFLKVYGLEVVVIPTNKPLIRQEYPDLVFRTEEAKFRAVAREVEECYRKGRPVLVGTTSIEKSEYLSQLLARRGIPHQVLNAKHHEREAQIVAQAGRLGAVTIATNMAGRGTDIILGGNPNLIFQDLCRQRGIDPDEAPAEVLEALREEARKLWQEEHDKVVALGGLHVIGTERHEARRIDNQLRGRSGRQGDPGSSRFYASFEDDIMRRFAPDWLPGMLSRLGMEEDTPLEHPWVSKAIEAAQSKVEGYNFDIRKHLVEYDDVMNAQREKIYRERDKILAGADLKANILAMVEEEIDTLVETYLNGRHPEEWDLEGLLREVGAILPLPSSLTGDGLARLSREEIRERLLAHAREQYEARERELGPEVMRALERLIMLRTIDMLWVEHLTAMEELRQGIGLHAYGQRDPLVVYKREAHDMWGQLLANIRRLVTRSIYNVRLAPQAVPEPASRPAVGARASTYQKVGRNDPCPCGSGRKYKKCHGRAA